MSKSRSRKSGPQGSPASRKRKQQEKAQRAHRRRRNRLVLAGAAVVLVLIAGGGVLYGLRQSEEQVRDLSAVGDGVPAVVQVHDSTCPVCNELRGNVASIEDEFTDDELLIRVADVHTDDGVDFAADYTTARQATLLFIDGDGELLDVQTGAQAPETLLQSFTRHASGEL
ncbi:MAG: hypothetical protein ACQETQ_02515 [Spirochaetota bacterium]